MLPHAGMFPGEKLSFGLCEWWRLLGEQWIGCNDIGGWEDDLRSAMQKGRRGDLNQMMERPSIGCPMGR